MLVAIKGEGLEQDLVIRHRDKFGIAAFLTPEEKAFIANPTPSPADRAKFTWRYECLAVMLWALGFDRELPRPDQLVDAGRVVKLVMDKGPERLREGAHLRSAKELLDAADLIYRYDWACVDARIQSTPPPPVNCEIVVERHHALNWLIGYLGQDWDDVSTDT
jgi:hypothetical protein